MKITQYLNKYLTWGNKVSTGYELAYSETIHKELINTTLNHTLEQKLNIPSGSTNVFLTENYLIFWFLNNNSCIEFELVLPVKSPISWIVHQAKRKLGAINNATA